jgi:hypothetical protein
MLFGQHDAQWIPDGFPGEGNILIFNNGVKRPEGSYSSVDEIKPPLKLNGQYQYHEDEGYGPENMVWSYEEPSSFFSSILSSAQRLSNGNTLICEGVSGRIFEINPSNEKIWEYTNEYGLQKSVFRAVKYPLDYPGIQDDLKPMTPDKPNGPIIGNLNDEYTYETRSSDPLERELYYQWDFDNGTFSEWIGPYPSGQTVSFDHQWGEKGYQPVRVRAKNTDGFISDWSSQHVYVLRMRSPQWNLFTWFFTFISHLFDGSLVH